MWLTNKQIYLWNSIEWLDLDFKTPISSISPIVPTSSLESAKELIWGKIRSSTGFFSNSDFKGTKFEFWSGTICFDCCEPFLFFKGGLLLTFSSSKYCLECDIHKDQSTFFPWWTRVHRSYLKINFVRQRHKLFAYLYRYTFDDRILTLGLL